MSNSKFDMLQWEIEYLGPRGALKRLKPGEALSLGANTYFAVRGKLPKKWPVVYVIRVGDKTNLVRISLMAQLKKLGVRPGSEVRLPQDGSFFYNATRGAIHVLATKSITTRDKLAKLVDGREPPPDPTTKDSTLE